MASYCGKISIKSFDLNLKHMLEGGQSFRWRRVGEGSEWIGVFGSVVWKLTQSDDHVAFTAHTTSQDDTNELLEKRLSNYLRLDAPLDEYYHLWSEKDANFKKAAQKFHGIRILNQDPVENVFSFICSSNNNIARISQMVEKLCELYGEKICCIDDRVYYSFPCVDALSSPSVENTLKQSGFGYRAKFIRATAQQLSALGGREFLESLMQFPYIEARQKLLQFHGIGPKVGDCICLMSLGHFEAVPVDTHVFQVACESYLPHLKKVKSVTDKVYREIGDFFRELYGPLAGWAHTILFCADLKKFKTPGAPPKPGLIKAKKRKAS